MKGKGITNWEWGYCIIMASGAQRKEHKRTRDDTYSDEDMSATKMFREAIHLQTTRKKTQLSRHDRERESVGSVQKESSRGSM